MQERKRPRLGFKLPEILGTTPLLHLVPKQEIIPLVSYSDVCLSQSSLSVFLPTTSKEILDTVVDKLNSGKDEYQSARSHVVLLFKHYEDPGLNTIRFKKPILVSQTERIVSPKLDDLSSEVFKVIPKVEKTDLYDPLIEDVPNRLNANIRGIPDYTNNDERENHIIYYKQKCENILSGESEKPLKPRSTSIPRKLASASFPNLKDSRIARVYHIIENAFKDGEETTDAEFFQSSNDKLVFTAAAMSDLARNLISVLRSEAHEDLEASYLMKIQSLCMNDISHASELSLRNLDLIRTSLQACLVLLHILSSGIDDRRLYLESYLDKTVLFLSFLTHELFRSSKYLDLVPLVSDCIGILVSQVEKNLTNDLLLGKMENMIFSSLFTESCNNSLDDLRSHMVSLLVEIFRGAPDQRAYISNELLMKFKESSREKSISCNHRLSNGVSVLTFAIVLAKLTEAYDLSALKRNADAFFLRNQNSQNEYTLSLQHLNLINCILSGNDDLNAMFNQLVDFMLQNISVSEFNIKASFLTLFDDLLLASCLPEWPGTSVVVAAIALRLMHEFQNSSLQSAIEPFVLELLCRFGLLVLKLAIKYPGIDGCDHTIKEAQLLKAQNLHFSSLLGSEHFSRVGTLKSQLAYRAQRSLFFFAKLFNDIQTHQSFSIFYQIDSASSSSKLSSVSRKIIKIIDQLLEIYCNGAIPQSVKSTVMEEENSKKIHEQILLSEFYAHLYDRFLLVLGQGLESQKAKLSAKAIRILSQLIDLDQSLLLIASINSSIVSLLQDGSPLSRDAVIELIGEYMFTNPDLFEKYYPLIGSRCNDDSVLIRKRVMRILKRLFVESSSDKIKAYTSLKILKRFDDLEANVVELAKNTLTSIWFENPSVNNLEALFYELVSTDKHACHLFQAYVRQLLSDKEHTKYLEIIKNIVSNAFSDVLSHVDTEESLEMISRFKLIRTFAEVDGHLVSQADILTLTPYVTSTEAAGEKSTYEMLRIMRLVLPSCRALRSEFVTSTQSTLLRQLTKFNVHELTEAVSVICILSNSPEDFKRPLKAALSSLKLLQALTEYDGTLNKKQHYQKLIRLINIIGTFGSTFDFEAARLYFEKQKTDLYESESIRSMFARNILGICNQNVSSEVKVAVIRNLLAIASHQPKLYSLSSVLNFLDNEIENGTNETKLAIISGIVIFLHREDEGAKKRVGASTITTKSATFDSSVFHGISFKSANDEICASISQRYLPAVLELCISLPEAEDPVLFLQLVMKLGLANPKMCISTIIALEASPSKKIKKIATVLHSDLFQRHESLADRNYAEAFKLAVTLVKKMTKGNMHFEPYFLRHVYRIVKGTYGAKKKFVATLLKLFEIEMARCTLIEATTKRDEIIFLCLNLLLVKYTSVEEICLILYSLDRIILTDGLDLSDKITKTITSTDSEGMLVENLQLLFVSSQIILSLIQLRHVMAATYNIRSMMMESYKPNKAEMELRQQPRVFKQIDFSIKNLDLDVKLSCPAKFGPIFTKLVQAIANYII